MVVRTGLCTTMGTMLRQVTNPTNRPRLFKDLFLRVSVLAYFLGSATAIACMFDGVFDSSCCTSSSWLCITACYLPCILRRRFGPCFAHLIDQLAAACFCGCKSSQSTHLRCVPVQDLCRFCGFALLLQLCIFCLYISKVHQFQQGPKKVFVRLVDVFIAAVPTGLATVLIFSLGVCVRKLRRQQIDILQPEKIKTIADVEVVCFDKTGTLTGSVVSHNLALC